jgi:hypothetical protein
VTNDELAKKAYDTWDMFGGRALGRWGAPYTEDAWLEVVKVIRAATQEPDEEAK